MTNVLVEYDKMMPTVTMTIEFLERLAELRTTMTFRSKNIKAIRAADLEWCDVYLTIRGNSSLSLNLMKQARKRGCFCVMMVDDNLAELPDDVVMHPKRQKWFMEEAKTAHVILSDNTLLESRMQALTGCARTARLDTPVRPEELLDPVERQGGPDQEIKVVYAAGIDHAETFDRFVAEPLAEAIREWGHPVSMTFIGVSPAAKPLDSLCNITRVGAMHYDEYRAFMQANRFDVGVAPLTGDQFSQCKYFNKFIEYTLMGITGVYTDSEPFTEIVEDGRNGFLCSNDHDGWKTALIRAFEDATGEGRCIKEARNTVLTELTEDFVYGQLLEGIPELETYTCEGKCICSDGNLALERLKYNMYRLYEMPYLLCSYIKAGDSDRVKQAIRSRLG